MHIFRQLLQKDCLGHMRFNILIHLLHQLMMHRFLLCKIKGIPRTQRIQIQKKQHQLRFVKNTLSLRPIQIRHFRHNRLHQQVPQDFFIMQRKMVGTVPALRKTSLQIHLPVPKAFQHPLAYPQHNPA